MTTPLLFSAKPSSQKNSQLPSIFLARVGSLPWFKQKAHKLYQTCFACYQFLLSPFLRIFELVKSDYYVELRNKMSIMCNNDNVLFNFFLKKFKTTTKITIDFYSKFTFHFLLVGSPPHTQNCYWDKITTQSKAEPENSFWETKGMIKDEIIKRKKMFWDSKKAKLSYFNYISI